MIKIIAGLILIIGSLLCYGAEFLSKKLFQGKSENDRVIAIKLTGYAIVLGGMLILFL